MSACRASLKHLSNGSSSYACALQLLGAPLRAVGSVLPGFLQSVPLVNLVAVEWVDVAEVGKAAAHAAHPESGLAGSVDVPTIIKVAGAA